MTVYSIRTNRSYKALPTTGSMSIQKFLGICRVAQRVVVNFPSNLNLLTLRRGNQPALFKFLGLFL